MVLTSCSGHSNLQPALGTFEVEGEIGHTSWCPSRCPRAGGGRSEREQDRRPAVRVQVLSREGRPAGGDLHGDVGLPNLASLSGAHGYGGPRMCLTLGAAEQGTRPAWLGGGL